MSFLNPPRGGFQMMGPNIMAELHEWAAAGLIEPIKPDDFADQCLVEVLRAVRGVLAPPPSPTAGDLLMALLHPDPPSDKI